MSPAQSLVIAFIALILAGSGAMYLPFTTHEPISYVDALFTATASVTVVGLAVLDFETDLTTAGQLVVLVLLQLGGLGIVTIARPPNWSSTRTTTCPAVVRSVSKSRTASPTTVTEAVAVNSAST